MMPDPVCWVSFVAALASCAAALSAYRTAARARVLHQNAARLAIAAADDVHLLAQAMQEIIEVCTRKPADLRWEFTAGQAAGIADRALRMIAHNGAHSAAVPRSTAKPQRG